MHRRAFVLGMLTATASLAVTRTAAAQPVPGGGMPTPVYLNMATKGGLFLENSARDAFDKTTNPRVKKFSRAEVVEQVSLSARWLPIRRGWPPRRQAALPAQEVSSGDSSRRLWLSRVGWPAPLSVSPAVRWGPLRPAA